MDEKERLAEDLARLERSTPALESVAGELRALLARLPNPTLPDLRAARQGVAATDFQAAGFGSAQSPLAGLSPGFSSGGEIGVLPQLFYGMSNVIGDPMVDRLTDGATLGAAFTSVEDWSWRYILNSGTLPTNRNVSRPISLLVGSLSNLNSNAAQLDLGAFAAGACDVSLLLRSSTSVTTLASAAYQLAATRLMFFSGLGNVFTNITSAVVTVELVDAAGTVWATSTPFDWITFCNASSDAQTVQLVANYPNAVIKALYWQIRFRVVSTGTGGTVTLVFGEPQQVHSTTASPPPFSPIISAWKSAYLRARNGVVGADIIDAGVQGDTTSRFSVQNSGAMEWGPGSANQDVRLRRASAGVLTMDTNNQSGAMGVRIESGADALLGVYKGGDANPQALLYAAGTSGVVAWGPGGATPVDVAMTRSAAKKITMNDNAGGNITLDVIGTLLRSGVAVSVVGHGPADHADVTRKLWLPFEVGTVDGSAAGVIGASPNVTRCAVLADAATQGIYWNFRVPDDWASGAFTVQPIWAPAATDAVAHTVRWSMTAKNWLAGTTLSAAGTTTAFTGASAARTINVAVADTATAMGITPAAAGDFISIELQRIGADAADTYVGAVNLIGIVLAYTANQ